MNVAAMQMFLALLSLLVNAATVVLLVTVLFRRTAPGRYVLGTFAPLMLPLAFLVALTATGGSLWFSESVGFIPCKLCWYQRIAVFPLPLLLGGMLLRRDVRAARYLLPVTLVGSGIAFWHWLVERVPALSGSTSCAVDVPCSVPWFTEFGFVTLAWMAFSTLTFVSVAVLAGNVATTPSPDPRWKEAATAFASACTFDEFGSLHEVHAGDLRAAHDLYRSLEHPPTAPDAGSPSGND